MGDAFTRIAFHVVFSTKERAALIKGPRETELYSHIRDIINNKGSRLMAIGGMPEHVHLLVSAIPSISVSDLVRVIKANSSRLLNEGRGVLAAPFSWQSGYGAFSVSRFDEKRVIEYITKQKQHHQGRSFADEYRELLREHNIEIDGKHLF